MSREGDPPLRPAGRAPLGCLVPFFVTVVLLLLTLVTLGIAFQPRYPGADPF